MTAKAQLHDLDAARELAAARRQLPPTWSVEAVAGGRLRVTRTLARSGFGATFLAASARDAVRIATQLERSSA